MIDSQQAILCELGLNLAEKAPFLTSDLKKKHLNLLKSCQWDTNQFSGMNGTLVPLTAYGGRLRAFKQGVRCSKYWYLGRTMVKWDTFGSVDFPCTF